MTPQALPHHRIGPLNPGSSSGIASLPVSALNVIPYFPHQPPAPIRSWTRPAGLEGADVTNDVYARLTGDEQPAFKDGAINVAALQDIEPQIEQVADDLSGRMRPCSRCPRTSLSASRFRGRAQDQIDGINGARGSTKHPARPPGSARGGSTGDVPGRVPQPRRALRRWRCGPEAALLQFDKGKMEVVDKGAVSSHFFPGNPRVPWDPVAKGPYYARENAEDFAWSNLHQDTGSPART